MKAFLSGVFIGMSMLGSFMIAIATHSGMLGIGVALVAVPSAITITNIMHK